MGGLFLYEYCVLVELTCDDPEGVDDADSPPLVDHLKRNTNGQLEDQVEDEVGVPTNRPSTRWVNLPPTNRHRTRCVYLPTGTGQGGCTYQQAQDKVGKPTTYQQAQDKVDKPTTYQQAQDKVGKPTTYQQAQDKVGVPTNRHRTRWVHLPTGTGQGGCTYQQVHPSTPAVITSHRTYFPMSDNNIVKPLLL